MVGEIRAEGVAKRFFQQDETEVIALNGINLTIQAGEFVSLIGPSGCGKSTLLRLIAGLNGPDAGKLYIDGDEIEKPSYERGLVFQNPLLFPWLNIRDNVSFGLKARKIYREREEEVDQFIDLVGLSGFQKSYPHQLSGGMAQRASLARALINHPKVMLLDEPLGALDAFTRMNMQDELIRIWQERKMTMIMVTHDVDEAIYLADRVIVMTPPPRKDRKYH
ncbi:ABC transporter ATP-binding protein [Acetonema longum]|uniref:ABC transporter related protein n=1 Tax=Acetonema longum DSM 6540 TaxID=1009370 RepID=F7NHG0_9FIRM|nr:ABC transporter ATP-binding protein [Acetonema longum]EGO64507.1 ABC transporter related protein [Acetonema longum DSM 6540]